VLQVERIESMVAAADANANGVVSFSEFVAMTVAGDSEANTLVLLLYDGFAKGVDRTLKMSDDASLLPPASRSRDGAPDADADAAATADETDDEAVARRAAAAQAAAERAEAERAAAEAAEAERRRRLVLLEVSNGHERAVTVT
jgi:hypothetical protein